MSPRGFTTGLAELVLIVEDVPRAADFYREVVGLEPESPADDAWAWFFAGPANRSQRIALHKGSLLFEEHSPHPEGRRFGNVHFALEVPRERLDEAVAHVGTSTEVYGPTRFDWMQAASYYFYDPDGNLLDQSSSTEVYGPTRFDWMQATSYYFYDPDGNLLELWSRDA